MNTLTRDNLLEIVKNLSPADLLSLCSTNKQYHEICKSPGFYEDLIRVKYNLVIPDATYRDYRFVDELENIKVVPVPIRTIKEDQRIFGVPSNSPRYMIGDEEVKRIYGDTLRDTEKLLDSYTLTELNAYLGGQPIRYFVYPQSLLYTVNEKDAERLNGLWFSAHTPEGALLKLKDLYGEVAEYGDYLSKKVYLEEENVVDVLTLADLESRQARSFKADDLVMLIETKRPYLDQDLDGSKLKKAYQEISSNKKLFEIFEEKEKKLAIEGFKKFYQIEQKALKKGKKRYFVINPAQFYPEKTRDFSPKPFGALTGTVIVAGSPEGALLRLSGLVNPGPLSFSYDLIDFILKGEEEEMIVITSDEIYEEPPEDTRKVYLIEINQPHII